jgi:hypothetical protein
MKNIFVKVPMLLLASYLLQTPLQSHAYSKATAAMQQIQATKLIAPPVKEKQTSIIKHKVQAYKATVLNKIKNEGERRHGHPLEGLGILLMLMGAFIVIFISILIGGVIMLGGLLFYLIGVSLRNNAPVATPNRATVVDDTETLLPRTNSPIANDNPKPNPAYKYADVVALKNGSVIKGEIIEMNIDGEVVIETSDGVYYKYRKDEILSMVKNN